eukprot:8362083-Alexandrium_andersonii.AAC.1
MKCRRVAMNSVTDRGEPAGACRAVRNSMATSYRFPSRDHHRVVPVTDPVEFRSSEVRTSPDAQNRARIKLL